MACEIVAIRHGETWWNREHRFQGHLDSPLTYKGTVQMTALGQSLALWLAQNGWISMAETQGIENWHFYASPLGRTQQSLALLCDASGLPFYRFQKDPRLKELHYGRWQGQLRADIHHKEHALWTERQKDPWHFAAPEGENYAGLAQRVCAWREALPAHGKIFLMAHGGVLRILRGLTLRLPLAEIPFLPIPQNVFYHLKGETVVAVQADMPTGLGHDLDNFTDLV